MRRYSDFRYAREHGALPEYKVWRGMIERCINSKSNAWHRYGGRGIKVCEAWRNSFQLFLFHMGHRPAAGYSLDRIDNDGDYEPGNCRWATRKQQHRNKSNNRFVSDGQRTQTISAWAEELGMIHHAVCSRLENYPPEIALTVPKGELPKRPRCYHRRLITYQGRTLNIAAWAREFGISRERLRQRLDKYSLEKAMKPPSRKKAAVG